MFAGYVVGNLAEKIDGQCSGGKGSNYIALTVVGAKTTTHYVFDDNKSAYKAADALDVGDSVVIEIDGYVSKKGEYRTAVKRIKSCDFGLVGEVVDLFKGK